jgi:hypothetical protein
MHVLCHTVNWQFMGYIRMDVALLQLSALQPLSKKTTHQHTPLVLYLTLLVLLLCVRVYAPHSNWMKNLPWNKEKTTRLQEEYDKQLLPILLKRLGDMGITVSQEEQQRLLSGQPSRAESPSGGKCPIPGIHSSSSTPSSTPSSSSSASSSSSSEAASCPMASAAATEAVMQDSKDILTLAVKLSQQQGADGAGVDLQVLMSQMKTFFAAGMIYVQSQTYIAHCVH